MPENFHSPFHPTTRSGQMAEGILIYEEEQRRLVAQEKALVHRSAAANVELGPFGKKFLGFGLLLLGIWVALGSSAPGNTWLLPGGLMALGAVGLLKGIKDSQGSGWRPFAGSPGMRGATLRTIWALRPRSWTIAWALIIGVLAETSEAISMRMPIDALILTTAILMGSLPVAFPAAAQVLDVPFVVDGGDGQAAWCATSIVTGLDPAGDGFLAVRSGPGSQYRKIDEIYNGDIVSTCDARGAWVAIVYGPSKRKGWVHGRWLQDRAG